jgi:hypothetical protein
MVNRSVVGRVFGRPRWSSGSSRVVFPRLGVCPERRRVVVRRFSDPVEVRVGEPERPEAFIWRGRLYVVRDVLSQWRERRAWWRDALDAEEADVVPGSSIAAAASEQQIWRVEASPGWSFAPGVYDLAHDESAQGDRWSLVRVAD